MRSRGLEDFSDEEMVDGETGVEIEIPEGGLEGMSTTASKGNMDDAMEDGDGSEGSRIAPANIFGGGNLRPYAELHKEYSDRRKWTEEEYERWLDNVEEYDLARKWQNTIDAKTKKRLEEKMERRAKENNAGEAHSARDATASNGSEEGLGKSLRENLKVSGGSKAEKTRILREMIASLENDEDEKENEDEDMQEEEESELPRAVDGASGDVVKDLKTGTPGSNADKTQDLDEEGCAQHSANNSRDSEEAEQSTSNEYSPGNGPSDPG